MPELTDAQKVMRNNTGQDIAEQIRLLRLQIEGGGLPAGGVAGMIPVKTSATDYVMDWQYPQYSRPNLLDNWYFINPVNQRGQTSWQNANERTVDRWKLMDGSASLGASGLTLNGTLTQTLETAIGQPVIGSALLSDGSMISPTYDDSTKTFSITATGQTIKAVKLELGSYQTLAHNEGTDANPVWVLNELPDYGQELAKCQRYYFKLPANPRFPASFRTTTTGVFFSIYLPVTMRSGAKLFAPNLLGVYAYIDGAIVQQEGFSFSTEGGGITPYANGTGSGIFTVQASKANHGLLDSPGIELRLGSGAYLSAE